MSYPLFDTPGRFFDYLISQFNAYYPPKLWSGHEEHLVKGGGPPLQNIPRPLHQNRDEIMDGFSYNETGIYQWEWVERLLEEGLEAKDGPEMKVAMARALSVLRHGNDQIGDG